MLLNVRGNPKLQSRDTEYGGHNRTKTNKRTIQHRNL